MSTRLFQKTYKNFVTEKEEIYFQRERDKISNLHKESVVTFLNSKRRKKEQEKDKCRRRGKPVGLLGERHKLFLFAEAGCYDDCSYWTNSL